MIWAQGEMGILRRSFNDIQSRTCNVGITSRAHIGSPIVCTRGSTTPNYFQRLPIGRPFFTKLLPSSLTSQCHPAAYQRRDRGVLTKSSLVHTILSPPSLFGISQSEPIIRFCKILQRFMLVVRTEKSRHTNGKGAYYTLHRQ